MQAEKKAVFFDRDGVLNTDDGYVHSMEALHWVEGAREVIGALSKRDYLIFVVTNQSGVARGYYTEEDVRKLHEEMNQEFARWGGQVTEFFYCPHLEGATVSCYDVCCDCRKPKPGMIIKAMQKYGISPENAALFGDGARDIEAAERAGIKGFLFPGGNIKDFVFEKMNLS